MGEQESDLELYRAEPRDRNAPPAARLFDAVVCLVLEQGTDLLASALRPDDVTERAGKGRASYYRTVGFPSSPSDLGGDPRRAVLCEAIARSLWDAAGDVRQMVGGIDEYLAGADGETVPVELVRALADENFTEMVGHSYFYLQLTAAGLSPNSSEMRRAVGAYYDRVAEVYDPMFRTLLDHWGYVPRPPLRYHDLTILLSAIGEGLGLRRVGDPSIDGTYYADTLTAVIPALLVRADQVTTHASIDLGQPVVGRRPTPTRSSIAAAAVRCFTPGRVEAPSLAEVAAEAGCSEAAVIDTFGGLAGVVAAAWEEWSPEFVDLVSARSGAAVPDPLGTLYRLAVGVTRRALEHRRLVRSLLISEVDTTGHGSADTVTRLFEQLLGDAIEQKRFTPPGRGSVASRTQRFARLLRRSLLWAVVDAGGEAEDVVTDATARDLVDYVWAVTMPANRSDGGD